MTDNDSDVIIPAALEKYRSTLNIVAVLVAIFSVILFLILKKISCFVLLFCSVYFICKGVIVFHDYKTGRVIERVGICESVRISPFNKDKISITFSFPDAEEENTEYKTFVLFGKNHLDDFAIHGTYLIYYDVTADAQIIAYQPV